MIAGALTAAMTPAVALFAAVAGVDAAAVCLAVMAGTAVFVALIVAVLDAGYHSSLLPCFSCL